MKTRFHSSLKYKLRRVRIIARLQNISIDLDSYHYKCTHAHFPLEVFYPQIGFSIYELSGLCLIRTLAYRSGLSTTTQNGVSAGTHVIDHGVEGIVLCYNGNVNQDLQISGKFYP